MADANEPPIGPVPPRARYQFRLWHALALLAGSALALGAYRQYTRVEYPFADLEQARALENFRGWRPILTLGDRHGPYRYKSTLEFGKLSVTQTVRFTANGQPQTYQLSFPGRVLVAWFANPEGNDAVLIFVRE